MLAIGRLVQREVCLLGCQALEAAELCQDPGPGNARARKATQRRDGETVEQLVPHPRVQLAPIASG